jgi:hypothetical protein
MASTGNAIDKVAINYEGMRWWFSKEGLNIDIVPPAAARLSRFDQFAGKLYVDKSKDGKISKEILVVIAKELDAAGFLWSWLDARITAVCRKLSWQVIGKIDRDRSANA